MIRIILLGFARIANILGEPLMMIVMDIAENWIL